MVLAPDDPWSAYARTVVTIAPPRRDLVVVRAAPVGETGSWPWPGETTVYVLTAWNPGAARPGLEENRRRQQWLESDLVVLVEAADRGDRIPPAGPTASAGLAVFFWPARGADPETGECDEGVAVAGLPEDAVLDAARRYGQDAVFAWSPEEWAIVACSGRRRLSSGWRTGTEGAPLDLLRKA